MKKLEEDSNFPVKTENDIIQDKIASGERNLEDLSEKEKQLFLRIFSFTPQLELCKKFGINSQTHHALVKELKEQGHELTKSESYTRSAVKVDASNKPVKNAKTPSHLINNVMKTLTEEERREAMVMLEEGMEPVDLMSQLIVIQSSRLARGYELEQDTNHQLHKTMNEAAADMTTMISKLHEMKEGIKQVHGFDDSFLGIMMALQKRGEKRD